MWAAYKGLTLVAEVLFGAGAYVDAVDYTVGCCMYVVIFFLLNLLWSTTASCINVVSVVVVGRCGIFIYGDKAN
jgi:hypothetical protein